MIPYERLTAHQLRLLDRHPLAAAELARRAGRVDPDEWAVRFAAAVDLSHYDTAGETP